jgi:hypothetical protein
MIHREEQLITDKFSTDLDEMGIFVLSKDHTENQSCPQSMIYFQQDFSCCEGRIFLL